MTLSKPVIAITQRMHADVKSGEMRDAVDQRWHRFADACGFVLLPLPNHIPSVHVFMEGMELAGVILQGGGDTPGTGGHQDARDEVENFLIKRALYHLSPLLGVCRGMQMIGEFFGVIPVKVENHLSPHPCLINGQEDTVNSFHTYALPLVPPEFEAFARAGDGVLEGMKHVSKPMSAIMWHPEREENFLTRDIRFFQQFFRP